MLFPLILGVFSIGVAAVVIAGCFEEEHRFMHMDEKPLA